MKLERIGDNVLKTTSITGAPTASLMSAKTAIGKGLEHDSAALFWVSVSQIVGEINSRIDNLPSVQQGKYKAELSKLRNELYDKGDSEEVLGQMLTLQAQLMDVVEPSLHYPIPASYINKIIRHVDELEAQIDVLSKMGLIDKEFVEKMNKLKNEGKKRLTEYSPESGQYYFDKSQYMFLSNEFQFGIINSFHQKLLEIKEKVGL